MKRGIVAFIAMLLLLLASPFVISATPYNQAQGSHPLQQVTTDGSSDPLISVDADADGAIDRANSADTVGTIDGDASVGDGTSSAILKIKGGTTLWSSLDFYDGPSTLVWGMGKSASNDNFYIDHSSGNVLTILASNRNVGIGTQTPNAKL